MASRENARRFHFLREIASGGFGSVYLAKVMHADGFSRLVAIKLLHRRWSENKEVAQRMRDEARLLGWLRHRNIVDVIDLTSIDGRAAVIMEYLDAVDLKTVVQSLADRGERIPPYAALDIVAFVGSALDAAYNRPPYEGEKPLRVIHRDIKPSNIMVDESGTVKVLDFGVARGEFANRESHTAELQFGSVEYMPPERLFFEPETDRADIYSLGASLFELLSSERLGKAKGRAEKHAAFLEDRLSFLAASCPLPNPQGGEVARFVREMCAYNADNRPRAEEVVARARQLARQMPGPALSEWAEVAVKPLVSEARRAPREPNPLTDAVMPEDSTIFGAAELAQAELAQVSSAIAAELPPPPELSSPEAPTLRSVPQENSAPAAKPATMPPAKAPGKAPVKPAAAPPAPPVEVPREDSRWDLLRRAALAEMESLPEAPEDAEDFGDEPTRIGTATPALMAAIVASTPQPAPPGLPVSTPATARASTPPPGASAPMPRVAASPVPAKPAPAPSAPAAPVAPGAPAPAPAKPSTSIAPAGSAAPSGVSAPMPRVAASPAPAKPAAPKPASSITPASAPPAGVSAPMPRVAPSQAPAKPEAPPATPPVVAAPPVVTPPPVVASPPTLAPAPSPFSMLPEILPGVLDPPSAEELKPHRLGSAPTMVPDADAPPSDEDVASGLARLRANLTMVPQDDDEEFPTTGVPTSRMPDHGNTTYPIAIGGEPRPAKPPPAPEAVKPAPAAANPAPAAAKPPAAPDPLPSPAPKPAAAPAPKPALAKPASAPATPAAAKAPPQPAKPAQPRPSPRPPPKPEPDPFEDPPASSGKSMLVIVGVLAFAVFVGVAIGAAILGWRYYSAGVGPVVPPIAVVAPAPTPLTTPEATLAAPTPAVAGPDDVKFIVVGEARSVEAECGGVEATGTAEVLLKGPVKGPCHLTLVKKDRSRLRAEVEKVAPGTYTCFAADAKSCTR